MFKTLINKTAGHVSLLEGRLLLKVGESISISKIESELADVADAIRRGWVEMVDVVEAALGTAPAPTPAPEAPVVETPLALDAGSLTPPVAKKAKKASTDTPADAAPVDAAPAPDAAPVDAAPKAAE